MRCSSPCEIFWSRVHNSLGLLYLSFSTFSCTFRPRNESLTSEPVTQTPISFLLFLIVHIHQVSSSYYRHYQGWMKSWAERKGWSCAGLFTPCVNEQGPLVNRTLARALSTLARWMKYKESCLGGEYCGWGGRVSEWVDGWMGGWVG